MLNHKHNVHKRTNSKILLVFICIFGLLFSYSCSCRNNVTGVEGEENYVPKTYTATRSGDALIIVNLDGNGIQQSATISFADAKVTSVTVDVGATGIAADVFKYENGGLTMTAFDNVTTTRQKVTATFSLAPNDSRDTLINPTETVEIEVVKATKMEETTASSTVANAIKTGGDIQIGHFNFNTARINQDAGYEENSGKGKLFNAHTSTVDGDLMPLSSFKNAVLKNIYTESKIEKAYFDGAPAEMGNTMISLKLKIVFKPEYEYTSSSGSSEYEYTLDAVAQSTEGDKKGDWNLQG